MTPLLPIGAALGLYLVFRKQLTPAPKVIPVPPVIPLSPGTLPNFNVAGSAATAALNLANYFASKGCDDSGALTDLIKSFQSMHNADPKGNGPASVLRDQTGPLAMTGQFDAKTAFALGLYTNTLDPLQTPCDSASANLLGALNSAAQALYVRLTTGGCTTASFPEAKAFQDAWNGVGLSPTLTSDGLYGGNSAVALSTTIASMLSPSTMTAPGACV